MPATPEATAILNAMGIYIIRRILQTVPTLLLITACVFGLLQVTGGDPIAIMLGPSATDELVDQVRHEMGLDKPPYIRYALWLWRLAHGDLGMSIRYREPVVEMLAERAQVTLTLAASATLFSVCVGVGSGMLAALRSGLIGSLVSIGSVLGAAMPNYFLALVLMVIFAVELRWVPVASFSINIAEGPRVLPNLIVPTIALGGSYSALLARITRASVLEVVQQDYVRTARAKGASRRRVTMHHILRNALLPVVTQIAINAVYLLGGSVLIETIFALPGVGSLLVEAIINRDLPLVQGISLLVGLTFIVINFLTDMLYCVLDPRIRYV
jgi:peptide/nickel transport system permease protein